MYLFISDDLSLSILFNNPLLLQLCGNLEPVYICAWFLSCLDVILKFLFYLVVIF